MSSMIELVKSISATGSNQELVCSTDEYGLLIEELYSIDKFLQSNFSSHESVPRIYTVYGVKINII